MAAWADILIARARAAATDLAANINQAEKDAEKEAATVKKASEKAQLAAQKAVAKQAAARIKQASKAAAQIGLVFTLGKSPPTGQPLVAAMGTFGEADIATADLDKPFIISDAMVQTHLENVAINRVLTSWASCYKKEAEFQSIGKAGKPLLPDQGGAQVESLFADVVNKLGITKVVDVNEVSPPWNNTSWICSLASSYSKVDSLPNSAA